MPLKIPGFMTMHPMMNPHKEEKFKDALTDMSIRLHPRWNQNT
jgi:hypothetical protein